MEGNGARDQHRVAADEMRTNVLESSRRTTASARSRTRSLSKEADRTGKRETRGVQHGEKRKRSASSSHERGQARGRNSTSGASAREKKRVRISIEEGANSKGASGRSTGTGDTQVSSSKSGHSNSSSSSDGNNDDKKTDNDAVEMEASVRENGKDVPETKTTTSAPAVTAAENTGKHVVYCFHFPPIASFIGDAFTS
jgi:hypothetical protein